jgi:nucleoside-diphosphate-sugar epimerase
MIGWHTVRRALAEGYQVRAMIRPTSDRSPLEGLPVEIVEADLGNPETLEPAVAGAQVVVHAAAHIGDWGPIHQYRQINVVALEHLITACARQPTFRRFIHISTLGVYPARDHFGTDETVPPDLKGLDGYTRTKAEGEILLRHHMKHFGFPAVILRPGFVYGPGERHSIPRVIENLLAGRLKFIGDGTKVLNNTYVGNLVDAIFLAVDHPNAVGETFNIRDGRLVTRQEYINTIADYFGRPHPGKVPLWLAKLAVGPMEWWAKLAGWKNPPLLTRARIKFMALNLDFSIEKARKVLGYEPRIDFQQGIKETLDWAVQHLPVARQAYQARTAQTTSQK